MVAAQLNELAVSFQQSNNQQPEAPPRSSRQPALGAGGASASGKQPVLQPSPNPLDPVESDESDSEPEETNGGARNDGTLLASDPPKPL